MRDARQPPGHPNSYRISCSFWEILAKSYVGAPPPPGGSSASPELGKSWNRHYSTATIISCKRRAKLHGIKEEKLDNRTVPEILPEYRD